MKDISTLSNILFLVQFNYTKKKVFYKYSNALLVLIYAMICDT